MKGLLKRIFGRNSPTAPATPATPPTGPTTPSTPPPTSETKRAELLEQDRQSWEKVANDFAALQKEIKKLSDSGAPEAPGLNTSVGTIAERVREEKYLVAIGLLNGLKVSVATATTLAVKRQQWKAMDSDYKAANVTLTELETWRSPGAGALRAQMTTLENNVKANKFDEACAALPKLKTDIESAHKTATEKRAFNVDWRKVGALYQEANAVPQLTPNFAKPLANLAQAYQAMYTEYAAGNFKKAQALLPALEKAANTVLKVKKGNEKRIETALQKRAVISPDQEARAEKAAKVLSKEDKKKFDQLIKDAESEPEAQNLKKALACGYPIAEVEKFAEKIRGQSRQWLLDNCRITGSSSGTGVQQQFVMSCQATMVQAVKGELDPIYALKLHEENQAVEKVHSDATKPLALEQKALLETPLDPNEEPVYKVYLDDANNVLAGWSKGDVKKIQTAYGKAQSNYERNQILSAIRGGKAVSQVTSLAASIRGKPKPGGEAVHLKDPSGATGSGRRGRDLLNNAKDVTGIKYDTVIIEPADRAAAVDDVAVELGKGRPVPLSVGGTDGELAHYVLAVAVDAGPPKTFYIHDPGSGTTVARTEEQLKNNQMDLPSGWSHLNKYEKPSPV